MEEEIDPDQVYKAHKDDWYDKSIEYWNSVEPTDDSMTGGANICDNYDIAQSKQFIEKYQKSNQLGANRVADCGSGIGRVSRLVLQFYFKQIDLIEPIPHFLEKSLEILKKSTDNSNTIIFTPINLSLQNWKPTEIYDAFWIQWPLMHLTDEDAINFLIRASNHLSSNGKIFVKDNLGDWNYNAPKTKGHFDPQDNSLCRTFSHFMEIFSKAGLTVIDGGKVKNWDPNLLPLCLFVLVKK